MKKKLPNQFRFSHKDPPDEPEQFLDGLAVKFLRIGRFKIKMKIKCLYGDRCRFAHGSGELRNVDSPGTKLSHFFKTKLCYFFEGDQRRFWNDRSHIASREMAVLSEQLELLRTEKHKADVEHVRKEHALNLKVEANLDQIHRLEKQSSDKSTEILEIQHKYDVDVETAQKEIIESKEALEKEKLKFNEYLDTQNKEHEFNLDQIHRLEKQLSDKSTEIVEIQHKYETLQKTETKQNTTIKEDIWDWSLGWGFSGRKEKKR